MRTTTLALVLLGLVAVAYASCPNQCSGHGRCTANDKCECFQQAGTPWGHRAGWTGADCSLRTCAFDVAFDAISDNDDQIGTISFIPANTALAAGATTGGSLVAQKVFAYLPGEFHAPYYAEPTGSATLNRWSTDNTVILQVVAGSTASSLIFKWKWMSDSRTDGDQFSPQITITCRVATAGTARTAANDYLLMDPPQAASGQKSTGIRVFCDSALIAGAEFAAGNKYIFQVTRLAGTHFLESNDNSFHQQQECSGRGNCDRASGQCKCAVGYEGEACQRTTCQNKCSGHGVCQDQAHFAADASESYALNTLRELRYLGPFDSSKSMGCLCDGGYRGPDCSLKECPSGTDPLTADLTDVLSGGSGFVSTHTQEDGVARDCSGRGVCDYSAGLCKCFKGYFGERCESQTNFH
jgi:hypothetical protein